MTDEQTLRRYLTIKNQIKQLTEELEEIVANEGFAQQQPGVYDYGTVEVVISPNVRFDSALAQEKFPLTEETMKLYTATVDSKKAKAHLTDAEYASCQKTYPNNKVEIKLRG